MFESCLAGDECGILCIHELEMISVNASYFLNLKNIGDFRVLLVLFILETFEFSLVWGVLFLVPC